MLCFELLKSLHVTCTLEVTIPMLGEQCEGEYETRSHECNIR